jgi:cell division transport system permease protein
MSAARKQMSPGRRRALDATQLATWATQHLQTLLSTLGQMARTPLNTVMTSAVIGIALALPMGLYVLLENAQGLSHGWERASQISLFLKPEVSDTAASKMANALRSRPEVTEVRVITRAEALAEFRRLSGFEDALNALGGENPLPAVLLVEPAMRKTTPAAIRLLGEKLRQLPEVDLAQYDLQWLSRLYALIEVIQRGVMVLAVLLSAGVLLIIGNTIASMVKSRREEIQIAKLFGATDAFIRRPFVYTGFWYGLSGALIAAILVSTSFALLQAPVVRLATLYHSDFVLTSLGADTVLTIVATGAFLGVAGSWIAVSHQLDTIEPA